MHRITLILILCLLLPDMYIYLVYIVKRTRNILWRSVYWLPTVVLVAIYMYYIYMTGDNALFTPSARHRQAGSSRNAVLPSRRRYFMLLFRCFGIFDARNQPPFCHSSFFHTPFRNPRFFLFVCPPASLHTTRTGIGYSMFCQYPLWCHCGYHALLR